MQPLDASTPEGAVIALLMQAGRRLRTRHPEDQIDPSSFPLAKQLLQQDAMRVSDLAAAVELDASTVSRQIKQLEDRGIVERTPDPADGRACLVGLTSAGHDTITTALRRRFERIKASLEPWSDDDKAILQTLLVRLAADLAEANERAVAESAPTDTTHPVSPTGSPTRTDRTAVAFAETERSR